MGCRVRVPVPVPVPVGKSPIPVFFSFLPDMVTSEEYPKMGGNAVKNRHTMMIGGPLDRHVEKEKKENKAKY